MKYFRKVEEIGMFLCIEKYQMEKKKNSVTVDCLTLVGFANFYSSFYNFSIEFLYSNKCGDLMRSKLYAELLEPQKRLD